MLAATGQPPRPCRGRPAFRARSCAAATGARTLQRGQPDGEGVDRKQVRIVFTMRDQDALTADYIGETSVTLAELLGPRPAYAGPPLGDPRWAWAREMGNGGVVISDE